MKPLLRRFLYFIAFCMVWLLVKLYGLTCRVEDEGPLLDYLKSGKPVLLTCWHQDMLFNLPFFVKIAGKRKVATLASQSVDGDIVSYVIEKLGVIPIRGSSSKGGAVALEALVDQVKNKGAIGFIVCDGPRPPARQAKFGIISLARQTGLPIIKVRSWAQSQYMFYKSWPKMVLVYPFSKVLMLSDEPLWVPSDTSREEQEPYRLQVEQGLNRLALQSEKRFS